MNNQQSHNITILINNYVNVNNDSSTNSDNSDNDTNDNIDINNSNNLSSSDSESNDDEICIICLEKTDKTDSIKACNCSSSYHVKCLLTWISYKDKLECEICKTIYNIPNKIMLKYSDEIENIQNNRINRTNTTNDITPEYNRNQINNQRLQDDRNKLFKYYTILLIILLILFLCGVYLFIRNYT